MGEGVEGRDQRGKGTLCKRGDIAGLLGVGERGFFSLRSIWPCLPTVFLVTVVEAVWSMTELWWEEIRDAVQHCTAQGWGSFLPTYNTGPRVKVHRLRNPVLNVVCTWLLH